MGFTTPCFIRKSTPELRKKLEELGYRLFGAELNEDLCIFTGPEYSLYSVEFFSNIPHPDEPIVLIAEPTKSFSWLSLHLEMIQISFNGLPMEINGFCARKSSSLPIGFTMILT